VQLGVSVLSHLLPPPLTTSTASCRAAAAEEAARQEEAARRTAEAASRAIRDAAAQRAASLQRVLQQSARLELRLPGVAVADGSGSSAAGVRVVTVTVSFITPAEGAIIAAAGSDDSEGQPPGAVATISSTFESPEAAADGVGALAVAVAAAVAARYCRSLLELSVADVAMRGGADLLPGLAVDVDREQQQQQQQVHLSTAAGTAAAAAAAEAAVEEQQQQQQQQQDCPPDAVSTNTGGSSADDPLMSAADATLWRWLAQLALEGAARQACGQVSSLAGSGEALSQHFTAVLHYAAPPANAPESLTPRLARVARLVAEQRLDAAAAELDDAVELLLLHQYPCAADGVSNSVGNSDSAGNTTQQSSGAQAALARAAAATASTAGGGPVVPMLFAVPACIYALLLSSWDEPTRAAGLSVEGISPLLEGTSVAGAAITTLDQEDDGTDVTDAGTDGPGQAGADVLQLPDSPLQRLARRQLELLARAAPTDTLAPLSASLSRLLGRQHPVAAVMRQLAEQNTSPGARAMREMRQQQRQLARARKLLQVMDCNG
jgi:hypothetical protein